LIFDPAAFASGTTTAYRYITEAIDLLSALAATLEQAVREASRKAFVLLDGQEARHECPGPRRPGRTFPVASPALPGAVHDISAAREHGILDALVSAGIDYWGDKGYQGAGPAVRVTYRGAGARLPNRVTADHPTIRKTWGTAAAANAERWRGPTAG
jgi:hypothetical protein